MKYLRNFKCVKKGIFRMQWLFYCLQKGLFIETLKRCQNLYKQHILFSSQRKHIFLLSFFLNFVRSLRFCIFNIRQQWFYLHPRFLCKYSPKCIMNFGLYRRNSYSTLFAQGTRGGEERRVGKNTGWGGTRGGEEHGVGRNAGGDWRNSPLFFLFI